MPDTGRSLTGTRGPCRASRPRTRLVSGPPIQKVDTIPAPLMSTIGELGSFLAREASAATVTPPTVALPAPAEPAHVPTPNGAARPV